MVGPGMGEEASGTLPASRAPCPSAPHAQGPRTAEHAGGSPAGTVSSKGGVAVTCAPPRPGRPPRSHKRPARDPRALAGPGPLTFAWPARAPAPAPHYLVLVRDELVYVFQIELFRHGSAAPEPFAQLPPAGNGFAHSRVAGRFPRQPRRRATAAEEGQTAERPAGADVRGNLI